MSHISITYQTGVTGVYELKTQYIDNRIHAFFSPPVTAENTPDISQFLIMTEMGIKTYYEVKLSIWWQTTHSCKHVYLSSFSVIDIYKLMQILR